MLEGSISPVPSAGSTAIARRGIFKASRYENVPRTGGRMVFGLQPLLPVFAGAWLGPMGCPHGL